MIKQLTKDNLHQEHVVEARIVDQLVAAQGYEERPPSAYDAKRALDPDLVLRFVQTTQPEEWARLDACYPGTAGEIFLGGLERALKARSTLDVLRGGLKFIDDGGIEFATMFRRPASGLNPDLHRLWQANVLSAMRQVVYSTKHGNSIDIALFVNGIPVVTMEVKNTLTKQTFRHAEAQYRKDRRPVGEPLLTFKRGALVHFALDQDAVSMTTRLDNGRTTFLPFNRGSKDGGAGNRDIQGDFRIAYLYRDQPSMRAVLGREVLIDLIEKFVHLKKPEKKGGKEAILFPRFHQLAAVRKLLADAAANGPGQNYLVQHSAGSGKSNTIAWLAHQAINLHDADDKPVFSTVIVITDRLVLDRQLQSTVARFEGRPGIVKKIEGTSRDLKEALESGARVIISTVQKFGTEHLATLDGQSQRTFAVIVDEAHSSQSGKSAHAMAQALTREASVSSTDVEDMILAQQRSRGPQPNISFFAFTATPRNVTLERFGRIGPDGTPQPFDLYSMRQAIEEGFILDVLENYTTYSAYYELEKAIDEDPQLRSSAGHRKVAKFAQLHPTNIAQKVEVLVEHFRRHVAGLLNGEAKAMVVTESREHALRYYQGINAYVAKMGYKDLHALVAFSQTLSVGGHDYTEVALNGFPEGTLPARFDGYDDDGNRFPEQYQVLVVAEKYQTGFDQPKLCAMYVDRKLDGLQAVQTLSRLNRKHDGKRGNTHVLDFRNTADDIREAFRPFYEATLVEERTNMSQVFDLEYAVRGNAVINAHEIDAFADSFFADLDDDAKRIRLEALVRQAANRFIALKDDEAVEEFRQTSRSFMRFYSFVAQVVPMKDEGLERLYVYLSWLLRVLPTRHVAGEVEITDDMLRLSAFRVDKTSEGSAALKAGDGSKLDPITEFGGGHYTEEEERSLSDIIDTFNERHGTSFTLEDIIRLERVNQEVLEGDGMRDKLLGNPPDIAYGAFSDAFLGSMLDLFRRDSDFQSVVLGDDEAREQAIRHFFKTALRRLNEERRSA